MSGPLSHLTILDLSRVLAGPWCTQLLADLGATVIKVEKPVTGDDTRAWGPPFLKDSGGHDTGEAAYYLACNRGKQSVAIDFTRPEGRDLVLALARDADALVENFKVGGLSRYGLDYPSVASINPRLVYASITGFGQDGPYADRAGYDFIIQGMSGFMSVTGERDDLPGGGPQKAGVAITDLMTGMYASAALLAALAHRDRTGQGQWIDACLFDSSVAMMSVMNMNCLIVAVGNDGQFRKFCDIAGRSEWATDPRFATNAARVRARDTIVPLIADVMRARSQSRWLTDLERAGIPCGPINRIDQVLGDPQVRARGMKIDLPHPLAGSVPQVRAPLRFSGSPLSYTAAPPVLGQDSRDVLRTTLGIGEAAFADLVQRGVVGVPATDAESIRATPHNDGNPA